MLVVKVKHVARGRSPFFGSEVIEAIEAGAYSVVGEFSYEGSDVEKALDAAWKASNNIEGCWSMSIAEFREYFGESDNPDYDPRMKRVGELVKSGDKVFGLRSSKVGDLFEIDGVDYVVRGMGFAKLSEIDAEEVL